MHAYATLHHFLPALHVSASGDVITLGFHRLLLCFSLIIRLIFFPPDHRLVLGQRTKQTPHKSIFIDTDFLFFFFHHPHCHFNSNRGGKLVLFISTVAFIINANMF